METSVTTKRQTDRQTDIQKSDRDGRTGKQTDRQTLVVFDAIAERFTHILEQVAGLLQEPGAHMCA